MGFGLLLTPYELVVTCDTNTCTLNPFGWFHRETDRETYREALGFGFVFFRFFFLNRPKPTNILVKKRKTDRAIFHFRFTTLVAGTKGTYDKYAFIFPYMAPGALVVVVVFFTLVLTHHVQHEEHEDGVCPLHAQRMAFSNEIDVVGGWCCYLFTYIPYFHTWYQVLLLLLLLFSLHLVCTRPNSNSSSNEEHNSERSDEVSPYLTASCGQVPVRKFPARLPTGCHYLI